MKKIYVFSLVMALHTCCLAADQAFYAVDIRANRDALIHSAHEKIDRSQKLPFAVLGSGESSCCFVFGAQSRAGGAPALKVNDDEPLLSSSRGDETYQFPGAYRPAVAEKPENKLGFGLEGMSSAKLIGNRTYEVTFADASAPVFVRHCLGSEGVNFKLFHSLSDKKPYVKYYFALGYDVKPDCPEKP